MAHTFKLWALYDPEDCRIITESDVSNNDSNVPWLKDDGEKEVLEHAMQDEFSHCKLMQVEVTIKSWQPQPKTQEQGKP